MKCFIWNCCHIRPNWNSSQLEYSLLSLQSPVSLRRRHPSPALLQSTHSLSQCFVSDIIHDTKMAITATALYDERNWESYLKSFRNTFKYLDAELTDPNKFPKRKIRILFYLLPQNVFNLFFFQLQTAEMATGSGCRIEYMQSGDTSAVRRMIPVPGSPKRYRLMSWWVLNAFHVMFVMLWSASFLSFLIKCYHFWIFVRSGTGHFIAKLSLGMEKHQGYILNFCKEFLILLFRPLG